MISYKIHLIRTGSTGAGLCKRYVGQSDIPLCESGRLALERLRAESAYPAAERVYSSPLHRCMDTAAILFPGCEPSPVEGLKDMNLGSFEGKTFDELRGEEAFSLWVADSFRNAPPGGEQTEAFSGRVTAAFEAVLLDMMARKVASAAVVTHGGVIMTIMAAIALPRRPIHQWAAGNGCGYTLLTGAQMWMRGKCAEVFSLIPN